MANLTGQTLLNQYRVDAFVASGGMGTVYRVWDLKRNVPLAMKVLHVDLAEDPSTLKLFKREARALKALAHPNIVTFYGLYQTSYFFFLLLDYVDGPTLRDILRYRQKGPLSIHNALTILKALSAALGYAHIQGVVHCDVKPGNVMVDRGGNIYLTDFGIARHSESTVTTLGAVGTPAYMTPEQIRDEPVTPATDVYALGVLLFEMLTGRRPFRGDEKGTESAGTTAKERTRYAHLHLPPPNPRSLNLSIPEALEFVVLKALSKDPLARYQNTHQMLAEAISAAGMTVSQIPSRVDQSIVKESQPLWEAAPAGISGEEIELEGQPGVSPIPTHDQEKTRKPGRVWLGVAVVAVISILGFAVLILGGIDRISGLFTSTILIPDATPVAESQNVVDVASSDIPTTRAHKPPTDTPFPIKNTVRSPTKTSIPPATARPPTETSISPTKTPRPPTSTPVPVNPLFTASENMYCREGPGSEYQEHYTVTGGQTLPVLARWSNHWLLLGINDPSRTRTKCCWVGGSGNLNVDRDKITLIDYLVDRIDCPLNR